MHEVMNCIKTMSDQELHNKMIVTSQKERELNVQMITLIEEAAKRKFFLDLGYPSLFEYLTKGLLYSAASAMRRISAARVSMEVPAVKQRLAEGSLSLSAVAQTEQFFRNEQKLNKGLSSEEKEEVLKKMENKSTREVEKALLTLSSAPEELSPDRAKPLTSELTQITFKASTEFMSQLEEVQGLLAHKMPAATLSETMAEVMKLAREMLRKSKFKVSDSKEKTAVKELSTTAEHDKSRTSQGSVANVAEGSSAADDAGIVNGSDAAADFGNVSVSGAGNSRYIPASVRRAVFQRDQGRCAAVNPRTGKVCGSRWKLEIDHYPIPRGMEGPSTVENTRLTCRGCNHLHSVVQYGREKSTQFQSQSMPQRK